MTTAHEHRFDPQPDGAIRCSICDAEPATADFIAEMRREDPLGAALTEIGVYIPIIDCTPDEETEQMTRWDDLRATFPQGSE